MRKEVIKKLATDFCSMDESKISNDVLQMKRLKSHPVARARIVPQDPSSKANEEQAKDGEGARGSDPEEVDQDV